MTCVLAIVVARWVHAARSQQAAVAYYRELGGWVSDDSAKASGGGVAMRYELPCRQSTLRDCVADLFGHDSAYTVLQLNFGAGTAQDEHLAKLSFLRDLRVLDVRSKQLTDQGLANIAQLSDLEQLTLASAVTVTDAGLIHLDGLKQLRGLRLCDARVTDAGLVHLLLHRNLRQLALLNTQVSDAGVVQLRALKQLDVLALGGDCFRKQGPGVKALQAALPNTKIECFPSQPW